jgi:hypothetical protein
VSVSLGTSSTALNVAAAPARQQQQKTTKNKKQTNNKTKQNKTNPHQLNFAVFCLACFFHLTF